MIDDIERVEAERDSLMQYRERFHETDKDLAVLRAQSATKLGNEIAFGVCLSTGFATMGFVPSVWNADGYVGPVIVAIALIIIATGVVREF